MKKNLYLIRDRISDQILVAPIAVSDGQMIRDNVPAIVRSTNIPHTDLEFFCVGTVTDVGVVELCESRHVPFDSYKFPEVPQQPVTESTDPAAIRRAFDKKIVEDLEMRR